MARMLRWISSAAFVVFLGASLWLGRLEGSGPAHADLVLPGGAPATLFLPRDSGDDGRAAFLDPPPRGERPPAIVLMHGFAGDRLSLSSLARRLASGGYAVLAIDARGHGENRAPMRRGWARADSFADDFAAAVDWLRLSPFVDGARLAVMGHSMGAGAALDFASRDSGIDAAVLISGGWRIEGPYRPPNALFLVAEGDPPVLIDRAAELAARLAERPSAEPGHRYGSFATGTAVELAVVPGADHLSIVWSGESVREILRWLDAVFGREGGDREPPRDARIPALLLMLLAFVAIVPGLGQLVGWLAPRAEEVPPASPARALGAIAVALAAAVPLLATGSPAEIVSAEVLDAVVAELALAGLALLVLLRAWEPGALTALVRAPQRALPAAGIAIVAIFSLTQAFGVAVHRSTLTPERLFAFSATAAGLLPFSLAVQLLLRRGPPWRAALLGLAGRAVVVAMLVAGIAVGVLPFVLSLMLGPLVGVFLLMEMLAAGVYAGSRNRLVIALCDAAWIAMVGAAIMPMRI